MIFRGDVKHALASIRGARWRSLLTMLGVIIGVMSVVVTVSLGQGVKQQTVGQINHLGPNLITVRPGRIVNRDDAGRISSVNLLSLFGTSALTENDLNVIRNTKGVKTVVPFAALNVIPSADSKEMPNALVVATNDKVPEILNQRVGYGAFFAEDEMDKEVAIIGNRVAEKLFSEAVPIGKSITIRGRTFVVRGVFEEFEASPLSPNTDYNSAIFIPYDAGKRISGGNPQLYQILVSASDTKRTASTIAEISHNLQASHAGQVDFTILKQDENLAIANRVFNLLTGLISGIAAISLIVGGIGIMNIMLVSVTERTREIGLRKAVGGTNRQILGQFLVESMILSFVGGLLGVLASLLTNVLLRIFTPLQPVITWPILVIALGLALATGTFFGVMPALKAARKDPIEALRHD